MIIKESLLFILHPGAVILGYDKNAKVYLSFTDMTDPTLHPDSSAQPSLLARWLARTRMLLPISFFIGGFVWDAITIGKKVALLDMGIFALYLLLAAFLMYQLAAPTSSVRRIGEHVLRWQWLQKRVTSWPVQDWPYWILQFLFGSVLSALFILYFKSSSYGLAWVLTLLLGVLLVANEFLESEYRRLSLCWGMFGLCTILWCNFAFPFLFGSVHATWFYLSTLLGASLTYLLYRRAPQQSGRIWPVWLIAGGLMLAYQQDMIPPVPLVKQAVVVAYDLEKVPEGYWMTVEKSPWWNLWRVDNDHFYLQPGQRLVCFSAVFAPQGLQTTLLHDWQKHIDGKWVSVSTPGFALAGGRDSGYRGYTYKSNVTAGEWRVRIQTSTRQTIAVHAFRVSIGQASSPQDRVRIRY